jgi:hypothetical protein
MWRHRQWLAPETVAGGGPVTVRPQETAFTFKFTRSFGLGYPDVDAPLTGREAFGRAIEDAEHNDPRNGESCSAEWLRAIAYGIAALIEEGDPR